jgi:hypothetical protein
MARKMTRRGFVASAAACAAGVATAASDGPPEPLRAGAFAIDITPKEFPVLVNGMFTERQATRAHDRLHARCLVLAAGTTRVAIAVVDSCLMPRELLDEAKAAASRATGIPAENMLISATHTHSAPAAVGALGCPADAHYPKLLAARIAEGIERAAANLAPARVGHAVVNAAKYTNCRRWILRPDKVRTDPFGQRTVRAMMHPGYQNPDFVGPAGPIDPDLSILAVQSADGRPVALLGNFSMHYFGSPILSADYYGAFARNVEQAIAPKPAEPPFVAIMSQGTSGDLHWMDYGRPRRRQGMAAYAAVLAKLACQAYGKIEFRGRVPLVMREAKLTLRVREPDEKRLAWARKIIAEIEAGKKHGTYQQVYSREQIHLHEKPKHELKLQALRIGDAGIVAIPCEVYGLTGLKIKAQSPLTPTINLELANGADGYIPPPEQHALGGYTTWEARSACLEVAAEPKIVSAVLGLLEAVSGKGRRKLRVARGDYAKAVLASRPAAYWRMEDLAGPKALDSSPNARHGRYEDGVAFYLPGPESPAFSGEGHVNRAAHFAGGRMAARVKPLGEAYTVELWFWNGIPTDARPVTGYLFSRGPDAAKGAPGDHLGIGGTHEKPGTGKLIFFNGDKLGDVLTGRTEIKPRTWYHVALVRQGAGIAVYLNGSAAPEIAGEAAAAAGAKGATLFLGGRCDAFANFEGKIDEVAVFDRALSAKEIAAHHAAADLR